jgi:uncharacterized protein (DUF934 family)
MGLIIKDRNVVADPWQRLDGAQAPIPAQGDLIVPLALWQARREELAPRGGRVGVWLGSNEDPAAIADDLRDLGVVAVNFPSFGDGRGYSTASLLRTRYGWKGELRAIGDIFRDQLFFLESCGFDTFELRKGEDPHEALAGFGVFSEAYQGSVARAPLFRRRAAAP